MRTTRTGGNQFMSDAEAGANGRGNGGGGGVPSGSTSGANGGSGVVIVRYVWYDTLSPTTVFMFR